MSLTPLYQVFALTEEDFSKTQTSNKNSAQSIGLAVDNHVKNVAVEKCGAKVPPNKYAPLDFRIDDVCYDIKSYSSKSVTVSEGEYAFAMSEVKQGRDLKYLVYEQLPGNKVKYDFTVSFKELLKHRALLESFKKPGSYYFWVNVAWRLQDMTNVPVETE